MDGVAAGLRHLFSPEDCLSAAAKGLAASLSLGQRDAAGPRLLSIVVDLPDVSAGMNFRHLQDWLCLKAVWLDRIDLGTSPPSAADIPSRPTRSTAADSASSEELNTAIHVQVGRFEFRVDLGPSIGRSTLVANRLETRLRIIAARSREFSFDLGDIEATGQGRAGGAVHVDGLHFLTRLRDHDCSSSIVDSTTELVSRLAWSLKQRCNVPVLTVSPVASNRDQAGQGRRVRQVRVPPHPRTRSRSRSRHRPR